MGSKRREVDTGTWSLSGNQACYSCSSRTGQMVIGQLAAVGGRQAGERTFPVCFTKSSRFRLEGR